MYRIKVWENQEYRNMGESLLFDSYGDKEEAISVAKQIYDSRSYSAVEVEDEAGRLLYHMSGEDEKS